MNKAILILSLFLTTNVFAENKVINPNCEEIRNELSFIEKLNIKNSNLIYELCLEENLDKENINKIISKYENLDKLYEKFLIFNNSKTTISEEELFQIKYLKKSQINDFKFLSEKIKTLFGVYFLTHRLFLSSMVVEDKNKIIKLSTQERNTIIEILNILINKQNSINKEFDSLSLPKKLQGRNKDYNKILNKEINIFKFFVKDIDSYMETHQKLMPEIITRPEKFGVMVLSTYECQFLNTLGYRNILNQCN